MSEVSTGVASSGHRILFVTGYYPPYAPSGAVRMPKLAKYWADKGHDVRIIAIQNEALAGTLTADTAAVQVSHLPFEQPSLRARAADEDAPKPVAQPTAVRPNPLKALLQRYYYQALLTPDRYYRSWTTTAVEHGLAMARDWRPDVIYSSGPPQSGHVVASRLAVALGTPWYAELRDIWIGNPYVDLALPFRLLNNRIAARTLRHATGMVAVTEHAGKQLARQFSKPIRIAYNGFDPEDFTGLEDSEPLDRDRLTIIHAGVIYAGRRDPSALFEAMARLGDRASKILVRFYHDEHGFVTSLAERFGVQGSVELFPLVPRREILRVERAADVLLLCRWNDPRDNGVIPGKVFEYIGARRPILAVGSEAGEAADIVRSGDFGLVSNDPAAIAEQLARWLEVKAASGRLPDLDAAETRRFDRRDQFKKIDDFLFTRR